MVMENERTQDRSLEVIEVFDDLELTGAVYKLQKAGNAFPVTLTDYGYYQTVFKAVVALYALERIQFMASFAATFAIVDQGYFQSIGTAVQKIMQDELLCHAALDREILKVEIATERGKAALEQLKPKLKELLDKVVQKEINWGPYLFSEGRAIIGLTAGLLADWVRYNAQEVYDLLGIDFDWERIVKSPLPWMSNWLDIDKTQNANQEKDNNNYALNVVKNDLGDDIVEFEFSC
jgi:ribonucleoside-diphosphate reductase beta chain